MKSTKCTISQIHFFNKVLRDFPGLHKKNPRAFPGVSRASKIFQGFPGFPGPVRTLFLQFFGTPELSILHFVFFYENQTNNTTRVEIVIFPIPIVYWSRFGIFIFSDFLCLSVPLSVPLLFSSMAMFTDFIVCLYNYVYLSISVCMYVCVCVCLYCICTCNLVNWGP